MGSDRKHLSEARELTGRTDPAFWVPSTEEQFQEALGDLVTHQDAITQSPKGVFKDKGPQSQSGKAQAKPLVCSHIINIIIPISQMGKLKLKMI